MLVTCMLLLLAAAQGVHAGEVKVAVAANFTEAAKKIGSAFETMTGHTAIFSFGSTGQLYTHITQGAPFDVFLAADQARPQKAVEEGFGLADTLFTYATGRIVLFSTTPDLVKGEETLLNATFGKIAVANPVTAPYGTAAVEAMKALGVFEQLAPKIVQGNNIAQTYQFVETGNAEVGFVAFSQVINKTSGSRWIIPDDLYSAIAQDAVLVKRGADNDAARAFIEFVRGPEAHDILETYGYGTVD